MTLDRKQIVVVIRDVHDDKAVQDELRVHCQEGSRRLLISPGPRAFSNNALAGHVLAALGVDLHQGWFEPFQLHLAGMEPTWRPDPEQLNLPFEPPPRRSGWPDLQHQVKRSTPNGRSLHDAIQDTCAARITELYVLRAQVINTAAWSALKFFARNCDVRLHLIVHGTADITDRLRYLSDCSVISRTIAESGSPTRWWEKPEFGRTSVTDSSAGPVRSEETHAPPPLRITAA